MAFFIHDFGLKFYSSIKIQIQFFPSCEQFLKIEEKNIEIYNLEEKNVPLLMGKLK